MRNGIDVSYANGIVDWSVAKEHIDFALIRCGYGQDKTSQDDEQWVRNVTECERLGIPFGVYLYSYADSVDKAKSEAQHVIRLIKGHKLSYPVYYDLEDKTTAACSKETIAAIAKAFCDAIEAAGYWVGIYANTNWWNNRLTDSVYDKWVRWVAQWGVEKCSYAKPFGIWQKTSDGSVPGLRGRVDLNECYDDYPSKILGKVEAPKEEAPTPQPAPVTPLKGYTVQRGDTLSGIAAKHGISLARIKELNPQIENYNLIYAGQTVYVEGTVSNAPTPAPAAPRKMYTVQRGDTLSGIAKKHGISLARIKELNPQIKNFNLIYAGQTVYIS